MLGVRGRKQGWGVPHLCHVAIVVQRSKVVEQLKGPHERLWSGRVHEVEVHLHSTAGSCPRQNHSEGKAGFFGESALIFYG